MGIKLPRKKKRSLFTSFVYKLSRLFPDSRGKFQLFLDLEWISERLCGELASSYYGPDSRPCREYLLNFISTNVQPTDTILDLGCGFGSITHGLSFISHRVVGLDRNHVAIDSATRHYTDEKISFVCDDADHYLTHSDEHFDVLILSHVFEHLDNPHDFLANYASRFKRIYIEVPDFDRSYLNLYRSDLGLAQIYTDDDHVHEFDRDELTSLFVSLGLDIINSEFRHGVMRYFLSSKSC